MYGFVKLCALVIYVTDVRAGKDRKVSWRIIGGLIGGTLIALSGVFLSYQVAAIALVISILLEIIFIQNALDKSHATEPVDKEHLVERIGLLAIVLLGESVISLSYGLTKVEWVAMNITAGILGFFIIAMIWWIYFGALRFLIKSDRDKYGSGIIYSQLLVFMSFSVLANTIRHAILNDLDLYDFRIMAISGMILLYVGKQTAYAINRPFNMKSRILKTITVLAIAGVSLLLPKAEFILAGLVFSFLVYILLTYENQENQPNEVLDNHSS